MKRAAQLRGTTMKMYRFLIAAAFFASLPFAHSAFAQTKAPASPFQDVKTLTGTAARVMVQACLDYALKNKMQVTIVVVDSHNDILELHRMDGAHLQAFRTAQLKAKTALVNRLPTKTLEERVAQGNTSSLWLGDFPQHGGLPVMVDGKAAGAIGVGGGSGTQDEDCGQAGIDAILKK
jgi:glc operon protein GlcG